MRRVWEGQLADTPRQSQRGNRCGLQDGYASRR
ncbi:hypothetical protein L917_08035 [Phytophthora nicotianae]|uniref:Uncharacterized protein n=3 Tax=Phytophthora nicotianae TaxID=4792 RepID=V9F8R7_PHYNI|nr:hypothetical protein F443_08381 [Phytophthora nicotianae P1569]ETL93948.1 hypothetical protein L917_08035 [Phytophthora nicotianae]ETO76174.1 hypothetical protein F444_08440 [Phytophthora nicotianae P1976]